MSSPPALVPPVSMTTWLNSSRRPPPLVLPCRTALTAPRPAPRSPVTALPALTAAFVLVNDTVSLARASVLSLTVAVPAAATTTMMAATYAPTPATTSTNPSLLLPTAAASSLTKEFTFGPRAIQRILKEAERNISRPLLATSSPWQRTRAGLTRPHVVVVNQHTVFPLSTLVRTTLRMELPSWPW